MASRDELSGERAKAEFDVEAMKVLWAGGAHHFNVSQRMAHLVANDPVSSLTLSFPFPFPPLIDLRFGDNGELAEF